MTTKADNEVRLKLISELNELRDVNNKLRKDFDVMVAVANTFIGLAHPYTNKEIGKVSYKKGYYPFIPQGLRTALDLLEEAKEVVSKAQDKSDGWRPYFLDAGCGVGNVMSVADGLGYTAHGVERCKKNVNVARKALQARRNLTFGFGARVFWGDILNFRHYRKYDVIYYYRPISNRDLEKEFEQLVEDKMKVGAVLVACLKSDHRIFKDDRFEQSSKGRRPIYIKVSK